MPPLILTYQLQNIAIAARAILAETAGPKVFLFYGEMGAGKTTLIKALCSALGTAENISSPTFAIVNEYFIPQGKIYHFDFYRIKTPTEALDLGCEEYFYSGEYCFVEWPEMIGGLLPEHYIRIKLRALPGGDREIKLDEF